MNVLCVAVAHDAAVSFQGAIMGPGYQFIHFGGFSRKSNESGQSTGFVFDEAERSPCASIHVSAPRPPEVVHGLSIADTRSLHDKLSSEARDIMKNGRSRAIRVNQQTLATVIASHPYTVSEVQADGAKRIEIEAWEKRTVRWLERQFGSQLKSVVRHTDEQFWHLHCYILPSNDMMKVSEIHPGCIAKSSVLKNARPDEDGKSLNRRGDRAYRAAMRGWQDSYFLEVGLPSGLTRLGPKLRRLGRAAWLSEKLAASALKESVGRAEILNTKAQQFVADTKHNAADIVARARTEAEHILKESERAAAKSSSIIQERLEVADKTLATALEAQEGAAKATLKANRVISRAERLVGFGSLLRAIVDGWQKSRITRNLRAEMVGELGTAKAFAKMMQKRLADEICKRLEADKKIELLNGQIHRWRDLAMNAGFERDRLRSLIPIDSQSPDQNPRPEMKFVPTVKPLRKEDVTKG